MQIDEEAGSRVGCVGEPDLTSCGTLRAGDHVARGAADCRRLGSMQATLRIAYGLKLDVNAASAKDLELLEGIGPKLARAIVDERNRGGAFTSVAELRRVRGIGPAMLARLAPFVEVNSP